MYVVLPWLLIGAAGIVAIPTAVLSLEILAGVLPRRLLGHRPATHTRPSIAVLIPAHNEGAGLLPTLQDIKAQLAAGDVLLVVADNCTDDTAEQARRAGALVVERDDADRTGKGYALAYGLQDLEEIGPGIVVMVDADCRLAADAIEKLAAACVLTGRPVQALYLMNMPSEASINRQISGFAWRVKNWIRPLGLSRFGLPCQLMGSGMAFPWSVIRGVNLASGSIVEDLKLGLELTAAGHPPIFCSEAHITSDFPTSARGAEIQQKRWEHGHMSTIFAMVPQLLGQVVAGRDFRLLILTLDLAVPPLSFLTFILAIVFVATGCAAILGFGYSAFAIHVATLIAYAAAIALAWRKAGRDVLPPMAFLAVPRYVITKVQFYNQVLLGRGPMRWVRTDRAKL